MKGWKAGWGTRVGAAGLISALCLLGLGGCKNGNAQAGPTAGKGAGGPVPVMVAVAERQDVPLQVRAIGWGESYASVRVKSRVDGHLTKIHFTEGQNVNAGDLLFTIDPRPFEAAVHLAEANLARDKALADDAKNDFQWVEGLFKQATATEREYGRGKAKYDAALAVVRADEASLEEARLNLEYCTIKSPIDGKIGERLVDQGNMVKANDTTLVNIEQLSPIFVTFSVAEQHLATIKQYMREGELRAAAVVPQPGDVARSPGTATSSPAGGPDARPPGDAVASRTAPKDGEKDAAAGLESENVELGVLTFLDNKVDTTTGTIRLKGTFKNDSRRIWPGQYVNVKLDLTMRKDQVVVPSRAVQTGQKGQFVFVVKEGNVAEVRPVVPGDTVESRAIITEGLKAGEVVVTDGQLRLTNGAKMNIKNPIGQSGEKMAAAEGSKP